MRKAVRLIQPVMVLAASPSYLRIEPDRARMNEACFVFHFKKAMDQWDEYEG
ncbi:MAG: hypothetical protein MI862_21980 [Desulfobacterales bacterium]|nr:hypothetical protein [Desulfobacterales bacterium]